MNRQALWICFRILLSELSQTRGTIISQTSSYRFLLFLFLYLTIASKFAEISLFYSRMRFYRCKASINYCQGLGRKFRKIGAVEVFQICIVNLEA